MAQDDKDAPQKGPFGAKSFTEVMDERAKAEADAEEQAQAAREAQLWDAEEQSKKLQPTFVNRAFVKMEGRVMRISFGERVSDEDVYRSAIVMTPEDAFELGQLLITQAGSAYGLLLDYYAKQLEDLKPKEEPNG